MFINERERQKEQSYLKGLISVVDPVHIGQQRGIEEGSIAEQNLFSNFLRVFSNEKNFSSLELIVLDIFSVCVCFKCCLVAQETVEYSNKESLGGICLVSRSTSAQQFYFVGCSSSYRIRLFSRLSQAVLICMLFSQVLQGFTFVVSLTSSTVSVWVLFLLLCRSFSVCLAFGCLAVFRVWFGCVWDVCVCVCLCLSCHCLCLKHRPRGGWHWTVVPFWTIALAKVGVMAGALTPSLHSGRLTGCSLFSPGIRNTADVY
ncbi:unnamed protein product [Arctogadus glacialis]